MGIRSIHKKIGHYQKMINKTNLEWNFSQINEKNQGWDRISILIDIKKILLDEQKTNSYKYFTILSIIDYITEKPDEKSVINFPENYLTQN